MSTTPKTVTVADLRDDIDLIHRATCDNPAQVVRPGRFGDLLLRCCNCSAFRPVEDWMLHDPATIMQTPPVPPEAHSNPQNRRPATPRPVSSWRCRTHLDEPVTWKGHGCRACRQEARA